MEGMTKKANSMERSEGENVLFSFLNWLDKIKFDKNSILILDEIDSGLSVEHISVVCNRIVELLNNHKGIQIIAAINNYHFIYFFNKFKYSVVINMATEKGNYLKNDLSYEEFINLTVDNRIKVNKLG